MRFGLALAGWPPTLFQMYDGTERYGVVGGGGGVVPVVGEVGGVAGRQRQPVAAGVPQTMFEPNSTCVCGARNGLFAKMALGRPLAVLATQLIQSDSFSACAHEPCTYQFALSPMSTSKRANTSFISISERKVPYFTQ